MALLLGTVGEISETRSGTELSVEWDIDNFSSLSDEIGDCYDSPLFGFNDGCWTLRLFPSGDASNATADNLGLCLSRKDSGPPATVRFKIGVDGLSICMEDEGEFSQYEDSFTSCNFCSKSQLRRNKLSCTYGLTVTCDLKRYSPSATRGVEELLKSLQSLLEEGKECDVTINVQEKEFRAHKLILQARSPVFEAMFSHDMVEKTSGKVTMEDCDPQTFPDFLKYVYTGSVETISTRNVFSLYTAADKYDLNALKVECSEFIKKSLTVSCFCDAIALAVRHDDRAMVECAIEFFCSNSFNIIKTAEWQVFLAENPTVGNELFIKLLSKHGDIFCFD